MYCASCWQIRMISQLQNKLIWKTEMANSITITTLGLIGIVQGETNDWRNAKQNANRAVETFTVKRTLEFCLFNYVTIVTW